MTEDIPTQFELPNPSACEDELRDNEALRYFHARSLARSPAQRGERHARLLAALVCYVEGNRRALDILSAHVDVVPVAGMLAVMVRRVGLVHEQHPELDGSERLVWAALGLAKMHASPNEQIAAIGLAGFEGSFDYASARQVIMRQEYAVTPSAKRLITCLERRAWIEQLDEDLWRIEPATRRFLATLTRTSRRQ